nr:RNA-directed DNA polymerase, eukaryota, reverse transcriptase zinc-binding domain protein [Tanacetum cinerariifolium]
PSGASDRVNPVSSFASVFQTTKKKIVKLTELRNDKVVEGAKVAIPLVAVEEGRKEYARALIKVSLEKVLIESIVISIRKSDGIRITKPALNLRYRRVKKGESFKSQQALKSADHGVETIKINAASVPNVNSGSFKSTSPSKVPEVTLKNSFASLSEDDASTWGDDSTWNNAKKVLNVINASDMEEAEELVLEETNGKRIAGNHMFFAIGIGLLTDLFALKEIHTRIWLKSERKELFCTFVYAHNRYIPRCALWESLCLHKDYVRDRPWCILGNFNVDVFLDDMASGSSSIDIAMRDFKECANDIEVMDVQHSDL